MLNSKIIEDISIKFKELVNFSPAGDLQNNIRALLEGMFTKLELVSRDEFDIQAAILRDTSEKLATLEAKLVRLELLLQKEHK